MNKLPAFVVIALVITGVTCKKQMDCGCVPPPGPDGLTGTWELREVSSSMPTTTLPAGNGNTIKFSGNQFEIHANGQLESSGTFVIEGDDTFEESVCLVFPDNQFRQRIIFNNNRDAKKTFLNLDKTNLMLASGCFAVDAGVLKKYERQ
ncbi:hypothetical protein [Flavihumibacter solisilvae]|uniref:Lipocalin-like domain-containing protein n=1 Tax=Flavihumibacter solisilvae TaxID=1349421 RepID=A0A0C1L6P2_9BACT|nr:hypothetical protein [Flavihumibacter solisilvae]KIC95186.1 hypothetical protein OI18_07710 [Flavihumibacter solisilvae]